MKKIFSFIASYLHNNIVPNFSKCDEINWINAIMVGNTRKQLKAWPICAWKLEISKDYFLVFRNVFKVWCILWATPKNKMKKTIKTILMRAMRFLRTPICKSRFEERRERKTRLVLTLFFSKNVHFYMTETQAIALVI